VDQWVQLSCRGLRPCEGPPEAHVPAIEIGGGESNGRENKGTNKGKQRANKGSNNLKGAHKWAHRDKCLVRGIKVTCEAATPWVEKQQTTEPHAPQSSEQVCLRVWGWMRCGVGQGGAGWSHQTPFRCLQQSFGSQVILFATALHGCRVSVRLVFVWNGHCALSHTHCSPVINSVCGCGAGRVTGHALWGGAGWGRWSHQTPFRCLQQSFGSQVILFATALHGHRVLVRDW
jgi:hypothetical protein